MEYRIKIEVNKKTIPLNKYVRKLTARLILVIVESLKGIDEDIEEINVNLQK